MADRMMLARVFEQIENLDALFSLKDAANHWVERMTAVTIRRATRRLRDLCMVEMYARVTVNVNHLASRLILRLFEAGETEVEASRFHGLLYRIVKEVQRQPGLHLHRTLTDPEAYEGLHAGNAAVLRQFLETAEGASLIEVTKTHYKLLPALSATASERDPRLHNIVRVYANEIESLTPVVDLIARAVPALGPALGQLLFDDEWRAYFHNKRKFSAANYAAVNVQEKAAKSGEPYLFLPPKASKPGVVLVHGLLASPAELKDFGQRLADLGHSVIGVRLKGHGTSPWDLRGRTWRDWLQSVERGHEIMSHFAEEVVVVGFATGASLALQLAAKKPRRLAAVIAVSAPLKFRMRNLRYTPLFDGLNRLTKWVRIQDDVKPFQIGEPEHPDFDYRNMPVRSLVELRKAADALERSLPHVACPVTILQAIDDPVVDPESARLIHDAIASAEKTLHMIPSQRHGILHEDIEGAQSIVISRLSEFRPATAPGAPVPMKFLPKLAAALSLAAAPILNRRPHRQS
jgi:esterase/lipase